MCERKEGEIEKEGVEKLIEGSYHPYSLYISQVYNAFNVYLFTEEDLPKGLDDIPVYISFDIAKENRRESAGSDYFHTKFRSYKTNLNVYFDGKWDIKVPLLIFCTEV